MTEKNKIPTPEEYFVKEPVYEKIDWEGEDCWDILNILYFNGTFDSFCVECKKESTFEGRHKRPSNLIFDANNEAIAKSMNAKYYRPQGSNMEQGTYEVVVECTRNRIHKQRFFFLVKKIVTIENKKTKILEQSFQKIGQHPSFGDLNIPKIKKYTSILNNTQIGEFNRAIGLASHDVGIGAYVYLRRVFESLISEAYNEASESTRWNDDKYITSRMSDKIKMLKKYLPTFLVENKSMYSLLSKGVHELSEEDCLKNFSVLRVGVELILDEKLEKKEKAKKIAEAKNAISNAHNTNN